MNLFEAKQSTYCKEITKRYGCHIYAADKKSCLQCQQNKYYYANEGRCCDPGTYPLNSTDIDKPCKGEDTDNKECRAWKYVTTAYKCSECNDNYHLSGGTNCCRYDEFDDSGTCEESFAYKSDNTLSCSIFDIEKKECLSCDTGKYLTKKKCCDFEKFNSNGNCASITQVSDCKRLDDNLTDCLECKSGFTLKNNVCCNLSTNIFHLNSSNETICITKPTNMNCIDFKSSFDTAPVLKCSKCTNNTFYLVDDEQGCCLKGTSTTTAQIWDSTANNNAGGCVDVPSGDIVSNCEIYDKDKKCTRC